VHVVKQLHVKKTFNTRVYYITLDCLSHYNLTSQNWYPKLFFERWCPNFYKWLLLSWIQKIKWSEYLI